MHATPRLVLTAVSSVVFMSMVPVLIKSVNTNEVTIGLARLIIALICISPIVLVRRHLAALTRPQWVGLLAIGLCFGVHWLAYFYSIKLSTASIGAIAVSTYGIHLLLLNFIFKQRTISALEWLAVLVCFAGCLLISPSIDFNDQVFIGLLVGIFSGLLYACLPLLHQRISDVPTLVRTWGQFAFAALFFLPLFGYSHWQLASADWLKLLALGVVCTVLAHSLWVKASTELPAVITAVVYYLYIPLAMLQSLYLLDEHISLNMLIGAGLIIFANVSLALITWRRSARP